MNELSDEIISILETNLKPHTVRYVFEGEPTEVSPALLPAAFVVPRESLYEPKYTGFELVTYQATVAIIDNPKKSFGKSPQERSGIRQLMNIMEKTTNGVLGTKTVVYLLRRYVTLNGRLTEGLKVATVRYGFVGIGTFIGIGARVDVSGKTRIAVSRE